MPADIPLCTVVHVSDLHFGRSWIIEDEAVWRSVLPQVPVLRLLTGFYPHSYQVATQLSIAVRRIFHNRRERGIPTMLVHSGDLTAGGAQSEFSVGKTFFMHGHSTAGSGSVAGLDLQGEFGDVKLLDIPGNHDLWSRWNNRTHAAASAHYGGSYPRRVEMELHDGWRLVMHGLDSNRSRLWSDSLANGEIPAGDLAEVCRLLEESKSERCIQAVVLHHPLAVKRGTEPRILGAEIQKLKSRDVIARRLRSAGAHFVLCGHIHMQQVQPRSGKRPLQFTAGSGCQIGGPNQFWVLDVHPQGVAAAVHEIAPGGVAFYERSAGAIHAF